LRYGEPASVITSHLLCSRFRLRRNGKQLRQQRFAGAVDHAIALFEAVLPAVVGIGHLAAAGRRPRSAHGIAFHKQAQLGWRRSELAQMRKVALIKADQKVEGVEVARMNLPGGAGDGDAVTCRGVMDARVGRFARVPAADARGIDVKLFLDAALRGLVTKHALRQWAAADVARADEEQAMASLAWHEELAREDHITDF